MSRVKYYIKVARTMLRMNIQAGFEYPMFILGWLLSNPIQFIVGFATIRFVVMEFSSINGWGYNELAFLYGLAVISHALSMMIFVQFWWLGSCILEGELDRYLLRPMNMLFQYMMQTFNVIGITDLVPGLLVFGYGCIKVDFKWSITNILLLLAAIIGATLIRGAILMIIGSLSFWTKSTNDFGAISQELFDRTTMYPITMYPKGLQFIFTFIIPLAWITFYPASGLLGKGGFSMPVNMSIITFLVGIVAIIIASTMFYIGSQRYESAGS